MKKKSWIMFATEKEERLTEEQLIAINKILGTKVLIQTQDFKMGQHSLTGIVQYHFIEKAKDKDLKEFVVHIREGERYIENTRDKIVTHNLILLNKIEKEDYEFAAYLRKILERRNSSTLFKLIPKMKNFYKGQKVLGKRKQASDKPLLGNVLGSFTCIGGQGYFLKRPSGKIIQVSTCSPVFRDQKGKQ